MPCEASASINDVVDYPCKLSLAATAISPMSAGRGWLMRDLKLAASFDVLFGGVLQIGTVDRT